MLSSLLLKGCIVVAVVAGQIASGPNIFSATRIQYYTNQSNAWTLLLAVAMIIWEIRALSHPTLESHPPRWLLTSRFTLTAGVMVTFFVFNTLLLPQMIQQGRQRYLLGLSNLLVHNVVPLLALADFLLFRYGFAPGRYTFAWGMLMPILYLFLVLTLSFTGYRFSGRRAPYFFLDYYANGWFTVRGGIGTFWWCMIILVFVVGLSKAMLSLHHQIEKRSQRADVSPVIPADAKEET